MADCLVFMYGCSMNISCMLFAIPFHLFIWVVVTHARVLNFAALCFFPIRNYVWWLVISIEFIKHQQPAMKSMYMIFRWWWYGCWWLIVTPQFLHILPNIHSTLCWRRGIKNKISKFVVEQRGKGKSWMAEVLIIATGNLYL